MRPDHRDVLAGIVLLVSAFAVYGMLMYFALQHGGHHDGILPERTGDDSVWGPDE